MSLDAAVDAVGLAEWDVAAVEVIAEEAGGRFSDFFRSDRLDTGTAVSSNGLLNAEVLAVAASAPS